MSNEVDVKDLEEVTEVVIFGEKFNIYGNIEAPLFLGIDVAEMIEYDPDKVGQMLELVDDEEKLTDTIYRAGQKREMWFVTEFGLYELLMQSRKPLAKRFKLAVKNVLKQIRMESYTLNRKGIVPGANGCYTFYDARIIYRNFSGKESKFNKAGDRNFGIIIDDLAMADKMAAEGWNIKPLPARSEEEEPKCWIPVALRFDRVPPKVFKKSGRIKTRLDEESVGSLDYDEYAKVDVTITPSHWEVKGEKGTKAYVKTMFVTLAEDDLTSMYGEDEELPFN